MARVAVETFIRAVPKVCFDAARDLELHVRSLSATGEKVVARTGAGPVGLGDEVVFEARHFGRRLRLRARVTEVDEPRQFVDESDSWPFLLLRHEHVFEEAGAGTLMLDRLSFSLRPPLRWLPLCGQVVASRLRRLLRARGEWLRHHLERPA